MSSEANDIFRIDRLTLRNFRCFEEKTIDFHPRFNVLIGDNGSGKTAVLDALAVACQPFVRCVTNGHIVGEVATSRDVRVVMYESAGTVNLESQSPCAVRAHGVFRRDQSEWEVLMGEGGQGGTGSWSEPPMQVRWDRLGREVRGGRDVPLPVVAYYRAERLWEWTEHQEVEVLSPGSRLDGYANWAAPAAALGDLFAWLRTSKLLALEEKHEAPSLAALKGAIADALADATPIADLAWSVKFGQPLVQLEDGIHLPFANLSHGWGTMLALVADLVRRCARLNPHLAGAAAKETPGVVLIDEIDLHLHPSWQRRVVDDLKRAFPKVQFIATTHSPFIIQATEDGEVIKLDDEDLKPDHEYADQPIEDIVEFVQGVEVPQRGQRSQEMMAVAEEYYRLLRQGKDADPAEKAKLKTKLDTLAERFPGDVAYQALLKAERKAAGLGGDDS